jgi:hypothetical protein
MAGQLNKVGREWGGDAAGDAHPLLATGSAGRLPLFRFGLRQLLVFIGALSILLAALVSVKGLPALALLLAASVITFHVFSTALGSRLRVQARCVADRNAVRANTPGSEEQPAENPRYQPVLRPRPLPWYGRQGASFAWLPRFVALAAACGGSLGAVLLILTIGDRTSSLGLAVGAVSLAALSGWLAFLGGSFVAVVRAGLREATAEHDFGHEPTMRG